jgi:hypothetical protein
VLGEHALGGGRVAGDDPHLGEVAHEREQPQVRPRLDARADDREHGGVLARERARGQGGSGRRAQARDVLAVHQREAGAGRRVK